MKAKILISLFLVMAVVTSASAKSFKVDGLKYELNPDKETVTLVADFNSTGQNSYSILDGVIIPKEINVKGKTYAVTAVAKDAFKGCRLNAMIYKQITFHGTPIEYEYPIQGECHIEELVITCDGYTLPNSDTKVSELGLKLKDYEDNYNDDEYLPRYYVHNVILCDGVTKITNEQFNTSIYLTNVTIPNSVTEIGDKAFKNCICLKNVSIPSSVTTIGNGAFASCGLTNITIPSSVTTIGDKAFFDCDSLTNLLIPKTVTSIGTAAFSECDLNYIEVEEGNVNYDSRDHCNALIETATNTLLAGSCNTIIPSSVSKIGEFSFSGCSKLNEITIPNSITQISNYAFYACTNLSKIDIPNSVTEIGHGAFELCVGIKDVKLSNNITAIRYQTFAYCNSLTSIIIPASVTTFEDDAFGGSRNLSNVTIESNLRADDIRLAFRGTDFYEHGLLDLMREQSTQREKNKAPNKEKELEALKKQIGVQTYNDLANGNFKKGMKFSSIKAYIDYVQRIRPSSLVSLEYKGRVNGSYKYHILGYRSGIFVIWVENDIVTAVVQ